MVLVLFSQVIVELMTNVVCWIYQTGEAYHKEEVGHEEDCHLGSSVP